MMDTFARKYEKYELYPVPKINAATQANTRVVEFNIKNEPIAIRK